MRSKLIDIRHSVFVLYIYSCILYSLVQTNAHMLTGYHVDNNEGDSVITFELPSGKQWRKRIWPRKHYPKSLHRWSTAEVSQYERESC